MSLLYKKPEEVKYQAIFTTINNNINIQFYSDCGKFGTDEMLDEYDVTPQQLLELFQNSDIETSD